MNILENRLKNEFSNNHFKQQIIKNFRNNTGIFKSESYDFKTFDFNGNFYSQIIEEEKFTNYLKSYENEYYKIILSIFEKIQDNNSDFFNEFELDEYQASEYTEQNKRLKRIIMKSNNIKDIEKVPNIAEFKPVKHLRKSQKRYSQIRLFVHIGKNGIIELYLVDLYHLGVDAFNYRTGSYDLDKNYKVTKEYKKCISKAVDEYINKKD